MRLYLGTHLHYWLWDEQFAGVPLFVSHHQLQQRRTPFPRAVGRYAVDSGAFTHLRRHGRWIETPEEYVAALRRYATELGPFDFAGQQDSICTLDVRRAIEAVTGRMPEVAELQAATVANYLRLRELAPDLPIAPTVQGDTYEDYLRCVDLFAAHGVDLTALPVVGVGSLVGRTPGFLDRLGTGLRQRGIVRVHGFGVKGRGLDAAGHHLVSADSTAWSFAGRRDRMEGCTHRAPGCQHCPRYALRWWRRTCARVEAGQPQMSLAI